MKEVLKIGVSGVRGVVGESFTPQLAAAFAQAFGTFVGHGPVVVGRDTRPSGPMIEQAVIAGLQSVGCKPVLAGVAPTPTLLVLTQALEARGGIAITASHNPAPWNALKFIEPTGLFLNEVRVEELLDIYHQQDFPLVHEHEILPTVTEPAPLEHHFRRVLEYVDRDAIRKRRFRVAVDCCNGVGALHSAPFLRDGLGCRVYPVFDEPTGRFERDPEPLPQNLDALRKVVTHHGCDIGFAQDPDGDRLAIVNERGEPIGEDLTLALAAQQVLDRHGKGPVAVNLSASKCIEHVARARGCEVIKTRIGEVNVSEAMLKAGAVVGGEGTGGVIIPRMHPCRDSYVAMAVILELLAVEQKSVSAVRAGIPEYALIKDKVGIRAEQAPGVLRRLRQHYEDRLDCELNLQDGIYVDFGEKWVHVRRSNTESVLRLTAEAPAAAAAEALMVEVKNRIQMALGDGAANP